MAEEIRKNGKHDVRTDTLRNVWQKVRKSVEKGLLAALYSWLNQMYILILILRTKF